MTRTRDYAFTVYVTRETKEALIKWRNATGMSLSDQANRALSMCLKDGKLAIRLYGERAAGDAIRGRKPRLKPYTPNSD